MIARRPSAVFVFVTLLTGLAAAQPPVPMYGATPDPGAGDPSAFPAVPALVAAPAPDPLAVAADAARERVERLSTELEGLRTRKQEAQTRLSTGARALYRIRRGGAVDFTAGIDGLLARAGRLERLERLIVDDARRAKDYARRVRLAETELGHARDDAERAEQRRQDVDAQREAIEAQLGYVDPAAGGYGTLPALTVAPMPDAPPELSQPGLGVTQVAHVAQVSGFALLRGHLGLPLTTSVGIRDAVRDDGPGVEFLARPGTVVMSVAEGRIAFAGDYGSYGRMIIIDHGDTFYTIYAGLTRITGHVGDWLARGASIGEVGGASSPLFFEVRRGTRSLDTRAWIGVVR